MASKDDKQLAKQSQEKLKIDLEGRSVNRRMALSVAALGLTTGGLLLSPVLTLASLPILGYLNIYFLKKGYHELVKERRVGIYVVDAIACTAILSLGLFTTYAFFVGLYFISKKVLLKTRNRAEAKLVNIFSEQPSTVWVMHEDVEVEVPFETLEVDDVVVVQAGNSIPVDGKILSGTASVDQRMLTGESMPVEKGPEDSVFAATLLLSGRLLIKVEKTGSKTVAAKIGDVLNNTSEFKSDLETKGEVLADKSALPTLAFAGATGLLLGPISGIAILLALFGYNMRIVAPLSMLNSLRVGAQNSILIKDGQALEALGDIDTIVFDKTGTLTEDQPHVGAIHQWGDFSEEDLLIFAAAAENKQSHPIALAILQEAGERELSVPTTEEVTYELGLGLRVELDGKEVCVGSERFMRLNETAFSPDAESVLSSAQSQGHSLVFVSVDGELSGAIELHPTLRPEVHHVLDDLRRRNLKIYIISGDQEEPTKHLADSLGIENYFAETLPERKAELITQLQQEGRSVCFIGDGINDSISLKQANVSISLSGASTVATDTAQIILMNGCLDKLPNLFKLSDKLEDNMKNNMVASVIPGVVLMGGVYFLHFGILAACALYNVGLVAGVANSIIPWLDKKPKPQLASPDKPES